MLEVAGGGARCVVAKSGVTLGMEWWNGGNQELSLLSLNETGSGILDAAADLSDHLLNRPIGCRCWLLNYIFFWPSPTTALRWRY